MKPRKFKITNLNNYTGYIGTIPVVNSIALVTEPHQQLVLNRQKLLRSYVFEEIFDEEEQQQQAPDIFFVMQRGGDTNKDAGLDSAPKKVDKLGTRYRDRPKKQ